MRHSSNHIIPKQLSSLLILALLLQFFPLGSLVTAAPSRLALTQTEQLWSEQIVQVVWVAKTISELASFDSTSFFTILSLAFEYEQQSLQLTDTRAQNRYQNQLVKKVRQAMFSFLPNANIPLCSN